MKFYAVIAFIIIVADFITKFFVQRYLAEIRTLPIIDGVFHLTYARNTGAAFGIFPNGRWVLIPLSIIIIIGFIYVLATRKIECKWQKIAIAFILGGAVGNLIDRVFLGHVVDFIDIRLINFAIFNVADIFITVGAGILIATLILQTIKEAKVKKNEA